MALESGISHSPRKNELSWNKQTLRIPWLGFCKASVDYSSSGDQIYSLDPHDQKWIQIGIYDTLHRAKARIRLELSRDSKRAKQNSGDGVLYVTATELIQAMKYGITPESVEECASKGHTHVSFGPALEVNPDYDLHTARNRIGIWRSVKELGCEKNQRHLEERINKIFEKAGSLDIEGTD